MADHTDTPWTATAFDVYDLDGRCIANMEPGGPKKGGFLPHSANARRIVQCVNACDGFENPEAALLEAHANLRALTKLLWASENDGDPPLSSEDRNAALRLARHALAALTPQML